MVTAWRIVPKERRLTAFDGEGARRFGGRWNSEGIRLVYTACNRSLACLETLVHLPNPPPAREFVILPVEIPDGLISRLAGSEIKNFETLEMQRLLTRTIGDRFIQKAAAAVLEVPSVIVPGEINFLINPEHPGFDDFKIGRPEPFAFDARLLSARRVV